MGYNHRNDEIGDNIEAAIAAALTSKHHWLIIACDSCDTVIDLDLTVKRRDPNAPIRIALDDVRCPRCNGHGRTRIVALSRYPSIRRQC
jgi:hypothetical protein